MVSPPSEQHRKGRLACALSELPVSSSLAQQHDLRPLLVLDHRAPPDKILQSHDLETQQPPASQEQQASASRLVEEHPEAEPSLSGLASSFASKLQISPKSDAVQYAQNASFFFFFFYALIFLIPNLYSGKRHCQQFKST